MPGDVYKLPSVPLYNMWNPVAVVNNLREELSELRQEIEKQKKTIEKLRKALEFYANDKNYEEFVSG